MTTIINQSGDRAESDKYNWAFDRMKRDWNAYFVSAKVGVSVPWAGGTLTKNADDTATYVGEGTTATLTHTDYDFYSIAHIAAIGKLWVEQYGYNPACYGYMIAHNLAPDYSRIGAAMDWQGNNAGPYTTGYWDRQKANWVQKLGL